MSKKYTYIHRASESSTELVSTTYNDPIDISGKSHTNIQPWKLTLSSISLILPKVFLSGLLLGVTLHFRVESGQSQYPQLQLTNGTHEDSAFLVDLNSTFLIVVASWMSSLAPMLVASAVILASYPASQQLLHDSRNHLTSHLLTPWQLHLAMNISSGSSWISMFDWATYQFGMGHKRIKGKYLVHLGGISAMALFISILTFAADTWLHIVTTTTSVNRVTNVPVSGWQQSLSLLSPNCTETDNSLAGLSTANLSCVQNPLTGQMQQAALSLQTLNNVSNTIGSYNNGPDPSLAYLSQSMETRDPSKDFSASSFGIRAVCKPTTSQCAINSTGTVSYNCNNGTFSGTELVRSNYADFYSTDETMSRPLLNAATFTNPFFYTVISLQGGNVKPEDSLLADPDAVSIGAPEDSQGFIFVLGCTVTTYEVKYDLVEGEVRSMTSIPSNVSVTNMFGSSMSQTTFGQTNAQTQLTLGSQLASSVQDIADSFGPSYSKIVLSAGVGGMVASQADAVQERQTLLVAKVPKNALFTLFTANLLFVLLGIYLTTGALRTDKEAREVQARLSTAGLVAYAFEEKQADKKVGSLEDLFEEASGRESVRIGMDVTKRGGYTFKSFL